MTQQNFSQEKYAEARNNDHKIDSVLRRLSQTTGTNQEMKTGRSDFGFRKLAINAGWKQ